jgi:hypothetical protein
MQTVPRFQPIVHIGYHKTATTWFQAHVWPHTLSHHFIPRRITQRALLFPPGMHFNAESARQILDLGTRSEPPILSEENLSGYLHNGGLHGLIGPEMARRIHAVLPDARIVIFVRNQLSLLRATYAQYVSGGGTFAARRYFATHDYVRGALTRPYKAPAFEFEHFEFDRLIALYQNLFGPEQVHVYPFEWLSEPQRFLGTMAQDLKVQFNEKACLKSRKTNVSLGPLGLTLMRGINLFTKQSVVNKTCIFDIPGWDGIRHAAKFLLSQVPGMTGAADSLPPSINARIAEHYGASNARLAQISNLPLADLGYPLAVESGSA